MMACGGKTAGIICSGPSVRAYLEKPPAYDWVLAVNRMVQFVRCDYFVFNDHEAFGWWPTEQKPRPVCFTSNQAFKLICNRDEGRRRADEHKWLFYPQIETQCPSDTHWTSFSMTIAMVLAEHLGAERIVIHGCDWEGSDDFDGRSPPRMPRDAYRWNNEIHKYGLVKAWLTGRGIEVIRYGYDEGSDEVMAATKRSQEATKRRSDEATEGGATKGKASAKASACQRLVTKRAITVGGAEIPGGEAVAEVSFLRPEIDLNYLTRAHCDGLVGPEK